jgi:hypothetical protein
MIESFNTILPDTVEMIRQRAFIPPLKLPEMIANAFSRQARLIDCVIKGLLENGIKQSDIVIITQGGCNLPNTTYDPVNTSYKISLPGIRVEVDLSNLNKSIEEVREKLSKKLFIPRQNLDELLVAKDHISLTADALSASLGMSKNKSTDIVDSFIQGGNYSSVEELSKASNILCRIGRPSITSILCKQHIKEAYGCNRWDFLVSACYSPRVLLDGLGIEGRKAVFEYARDVENDEDLDTNNSLKCSVLSAYLGGDMDSASIPYCISDKELWLLISLGAIVLQCV